MSLMATLDSSDMDSAVALSSNVKRQSTKKVENQRMVVTITATAAVCLRRISLQCQFNWFVI